jgi:hypothetical protein
MFWVLMIVRKMSKKHGGNAHKENLHKGCLHNKTQINTHD